MSFYFKHMVDSGDLKKKILMVLPLDATFHLSRQMRKRTNRHKYAVS